MTRRIVFRPEAETELAEAVDWYEARSQGLGAEFLRSLDAVLAQVQRHPTLYPVVFGTARRAVLRRFPYSLIYVLRDDELLIAACIHSRRDPKRWQERI
ncbi:MAG: type II toxin-antitoxin system RelE/ParE family toxin [Nitrospiraceae bacterium]